MDVVITFKSGRKTKVTAKDYADNQFREFVTRNFMKPDGNAYGFVVWDDMLVNIAEIESVEAVK